MSVQTRGVPWQTFNDSQSLGKGRCATTCKLRRTRNIEELVPWLYLQGISTNDFSECLQQLTGSDAASLSPTPVVRLEDAWSQEYQDFAKRSLASKRYVDFWGDGIYFDTRLVENRQCMLVVIGTTHDGRKEFVAIADGSRESAQSWKEILIDPKMRGLEQPPEIAAGDGALGFWKALAEVFPRTRQRRHSTPLRPRDRESHAQRVAVPRPGDRTDSPRPRPGRAAGPRRAADDERVAGNEALFTSEIAAIIGLARRATRTRLARLVEQGLLREPGTGPRDPERRCARTR